MERDDLLELMLSYYHHLARHPWACQVITMRAPRGPNYLGLSEKICVLLTARGSTNPLGEAYLLCNFVIGSATTTSLVSDEREAAVDPERAPLYAALHAKHDTSPADLVTAGPTALLGR